MTENTTRPASGENGTVVADEALVRIAWYYYKDGLTQAQVADRMGISRASVGRHLDRARTSGIVSIDIDPRYLTYFNLARRLCRAYGLTDAFVIPDLGPNEETSQEAVNNRLAQGAAQYLDRSLPHHHAVGLGFGDTVSRTLGFCQASTFRDLTLVTLTGGINAYLYALDGLRTQGSNTTRGTQTAKIIPTPIFASTPELAAALRSDDAVRSVIEDAARVDIAITGIGAMSKDATLVQWGFYESEELLRMDKDEGVVGDVLGMFFDNEGRYRDTPWASRRIGIGPDDFAKIPTKVAVAGGTAKIRAICAALQGRLFDILITNETVAQMMLDESAER